MLTAEQYRQAEFGYTLAESRRGFKIHAAVYAIVMTGLIVLNALLWTYRDGDFPWAVFPLVGWGIGPAFHYVYGFRGPPARLERASGRSRHTRRHARLRRPRPLLPAFARFSGRKPT
jgi:hypothetical protein